MQILFLSFITKFLPHSPDKFSFKQISEHDVSKLLADLPNNKATGIDNIRSRLLKIAAPAISNSLAYVFNRSLQHGVVPDEWKKARISAIFKKGTKTDPGNYRPISILPVISKILERIVHRQVYEFCIKHNILCIEQSGFRPNHSTQTSLHKFTEDAFNEIENGNCVGLVALDLKKAFDTVDHEILLNKLEHYGFRDISLLWFRNYLNNRMQIACINGNQSNPRLIQTGVPQGSILGPLLFILYINDIGVCFEHATVNIYADDTLFYFAGSSIDSVSEALKADLHHVAEWLCSNKLSLHIGKTNSMLISSKPKSQTLQDIELNLSLDNQNISQVSSCKYLGIILDSKLNFHAHLDSVVSKLKKASGVFFRASKFLPPDCKLTLYNTLILPHIDYCSTVWSTSLRKSDLARLQRIQNRAMRIILDCHPRTHITDMLDTLKWMSINQRLNFNLGIFLWKIVNDKVPPYLSNIFTPVSQIHTHNTRSASSGRLHRNRTHTKTLSTTGSKFWNKIPQHVRDARSLYSFKRNLIPHIFSTIDRF